MGRGGGAFVQTEAGTIATVRYLTGHLGLPTHVSGETVQRMARFIGSDAKPLLLHPLYPGPRESEPYLLQRSHLPQVLLACDASVLGSPLLPWSSRSHTDKLCVPLYSTLPYRYHTELLPTMPPLFPGHMDKLCVPPYLTLPYGCHAGLLPTEPLLPAKPNH